MEIKRKVMKETGIEESRICCILDINGDPVDGHGHCTSCDNCHTSYINRVFNENI